MSECAVVWYDGLWRDEMGCFVQCCVTIFCVVLACYSGRNYTCPHDVIYPVIFTTYGPRRLSQVTVPTPFTQQCLSHLWLSGIAKTAMMTTTPNQETQTVHKSGDTKDVCSPPLWMSTPDFPIGPNWRAFLQGWILIVSEFRRTLQRRIIRQFYWQVWWWAWGRGEKERCAMRYYGVEDTRR